MFNDCYGSNVWNGVFTVALVICVLALITCIVFGILFGNGCIDWPILMIPVIVFVFAFVGLGVSGVIASTTDDKNIKEAILENYPDAVFMNNSQQFVSDGITYVYSVSNKELKIQPSNSKTITVNTETATDTIVTTSDIKSVILENYPASKINYTDSDSTGYFEYENEFYSFTIDGMNIVVKDNTGKMINVLIIGK